jgi:hypothetical protein
MDTIFANKFWSNVDTQGDKRHLCWLWRGPVSADGQARFRSGPVVTTVYRLAWELKCGPIPEGERVSHTCGTKTCCNPWHLSRSSTTQIMGAEIMMDKLEKSWDEDQDNNA